MDRLQEKNDLIFMLAQVVGPLTHLTDALDSNEQMRLVGRFMHDKSELSSRVDKFCSSEPNHSYQHISQNFHVSKDGLHTLHIAARELPPDKIVGVAQRAYPFLLHCLQSIPVVPQSEIFEAETPFQCYNFLRNLCASATQSVFIFDRYLDTTIFHRYLHGLNPAAVATLVTLPQSETKGKGNVARYAAFLDVSRLYAAERGPAKYRLMTLPGSDFHDRWLRVDNQLFGLGGSLKDLEQRFTVSKIDSTPANIAKVDAAVKAAAEVFGPANPNHT